MSTSLLVAGFSDAVPPFTARYQCLDVESLLTLASSNRVKGASEEDEFVSTALLCLRLYSVYHMISKREDVVESCLLYLSFAAEGVTKEYTCFKLLVFGCRSFFVSLPLYLVLGFETCAGKPKKKMNQSKQASRSDISKPLGVTGEDVCF